MKPAESTITYVVYSPNYVPGEGRYKKARNLAEARHFMRGFGVGASCIRKIRRTNRKAYSRWYAPYRDLGKGGRRFFELVYKGEQ